MDKYVNKERKPEERYPLLLVYVQENGKRKHFDEHHVIFSDKERAQLSQCWLTSTLLASGVILLLIMLFSGSIIPFGHPIMPRCVPETDNLVNANKTIHVVKHGIKWDAKQLDILKFIAEIYPDYEIQAIVLDLTKDKLLKRSLDDTGSNELATRLISIPMNTLNSDIDITKQNNNNIPEKVEKEIPIAPISPPSPPPPPSEENNTPDTNRYESKLFPEPIIFPEINSLFRRFNEIIDRHRKMFESAVNNDIFGLDNNDLERNVIFVDGKIDSPIDIFPFPLNLSVVTDLQNRTKRSGFDTPAKTFEDISALFPNIKEKKMTYHQYFMNTLLHSIWPHMNRQMALFAIRTNQVWQNGGLSFYLPANENETNTHLAQCDYENEMVYEDNINIVDLKTIIINTKYQFQELADNKVTIDSKGYHMATRIPCHALFGELLLQIQKVRDYAIETILEGVLDTFCKQDAVESDYCQKFIM